MSAEKNCFHSNSQISNAAISKCQDFSNNYKQIDEAVSFVYCQQIFLFILISKFTIKLKSKLYEQENRERFLIRNLCFST